MIDALDHIDGARLVPRWRGRSVRDACSGGGRENGRLRVGNVGVAIEDHASTAQLSSMVFATESLDKAARLLERRAMPSERMVIGSCFRQRRRHGVPIVLVERTRARNPRPAEEQRGGVDRRARSRRGSHARPRARDSALCRATRPRPSARPGQSGLGLAAAVLPLRRSGGRDRARFEQGRVRRAGPAMGPVVAHAQHRGGPTSASRRPASRSPNRAKGAGPAHRSSRCRATLPTCRPS